MLRESGLAATAGQNAGKSVGKQLCNRHPAVGRVERGWQRVGHLVNKYAATVALATQKNDACPWWSALGRTRASSGMAGHAKTSRRLFCVFLSNRGDYEALPLRRFFGLFRAP